jgi:nitroreductase
MTTIDALTDFERLAMSRRAVRNFLPDAVPDDLLKRLLETARWAPSGYNLQPTHFVVVTDPDIRARLRPACMNQRQVTDAPVVVALTGDAKVVRNNLEEFLAADRNAGAMNAEYEKLLRRVIPLAFGRGPMGLGWLWKSTLIPIVRVFKPIPGLPAVNPRFWAAKQVMLAAMNLMLAASAAGLASLPMEGFDESRVKRVLKIPRSHVVPVIVTMGYPVPGPAPVKSRLPLEKFVHRETW